MELESNDKTIWSNDSLQNMVQPLSIVDVQPFPDPANSLDGQGRSIGPAT